MNQGEVCGSVRAGIRRLRRLAPQAFHFPLAIAIENPNSGPDLVTCCQALGVPHTPVPEAAFRSWFPALRLPSGCNFFRVRDGTIDLAILTRMLIRRTRMLIRRTRMLIRRLEAMSVELVRRSVRTLERHGDVIQGMSFADGKRVTNYADDIIVLCCSGAIRPLLGGVDVTVPVLTVACSHLIATEKTQLPVLLRVSKGGPCVVPHHTTSGLLNIFGNSGRTILAPDTDGQRLQTEPAAIESIREEAAQWFGIEIPVDAFAWAARKVEIVAPGSVRSQSHHCLAVLDNCLISLPGKISQSAETGQLAARLILRNKLGNSIVRSIWDQSVSEEDSRSRVKRSGTNPRLAAAT